MWYLVERGYGTEDYPLISSALLNNGRARVRNKNRDVAIEVSIDNRKLAVFTGEISGNLDCVKLTGIIGVEALMLLREFDTAIIYSANPEKFPDRKYLIIESVEPYTCIEWHDSPPTS